jgi:hypothetical protein
MLQKFRQPHSSRTLARPLDRHHRISSDPKPSGKMLDPPGNLIATQIILIALAITFHA